MSQSIITKRCCTCNTIKPVEMFYKDNRKEGSLRGRCKPCQRAHGKRHYQRPEVKAKKAAYQRRRDVKARRPAIARRYVASNQHKVAAHRAVRYAILAGRLPHISAHLCHSCGVQAEQHHHPSYLPQHRLWVVPLCRSCHQAHHARD